MMVHSSQEVVIPGQTVAKAVGSLSKTQREVVRRGCFSGDFTMATVRALKSKGIFYHHITSPDGRCGPMELTSLGKAARAALLAADISPLDDPQQPTEQKARHD